MDGAQPTDVRHNSAHFAAVLAAVLGAVADESRLPSLVVKRKMVY